MAVVSLVNGLTTGGLLSFDDFWTAAGAENMPAFRRTTISTTRDQSSEQNQHQTMKCSFACFVVASHAHTLKSITFPYMAGLP